MCGLFMLRMTFGLGIDSCICNALLFKLVSKATGRTFCDPGTLTMKSPSMALVTGFCGSEKQVLL